MYLSHYSRQDSGRHGINQELIPLPPERVSNMCVGENDGHDDNSSCGFCYRKVRRLWLFQRFEYSGGRCCSRANESPFECIAPSYEILKIAGSGAICHLIGSVAPKPAPPGCACHFLSLGNLGFATNRYSKHPQNCQIDQLGYHGGIFHVFHIGWIVGDVSDIWRFRNQDSCIRRL